ncbi:MAG: DUF4364 family protein [Clostridia bacterium]
MAKDLEIFDNKLLVLYVLDTSDKKLSINQIVDFFEEFEDITYFDISIYIESLRASNYIKEIYEDENVFYGITESGVLALKELIEFIPGVNLHTLKKIANRNISKIKTDYSIASTVKIVRLSEYKVSCYIKDGNDELVNISIYAGNKDQVKNITKNWNKDAEKIYTTLLDMLTKD